MNEMKLLTPKQVAEMLGLRPRTITKWCRQDQVLGAVKVGRVWRIPEQFVHDLLNRGHR